MISSAEWLTDEKPDELGIVFFKFKNSDDSTRQNTKKFLQRCRSNPEGRWTRQSQGERILMLGKEKEEALNEQPITDQPQKVPYLSHLGNRAGRFGRYHSVSTTADVVINLGHDIFVANSSDCSAYPEDTKMERRASIAYSESINAQRYFECATCMCGVPPERIIWCYSQWQPAYSELLNTVPNIEFVKDIPENLEQDSYFDDNKRNVIDHFTVVAQ